MRTGRGVRHLFTSSDEDSEEDAAEGRDGQGIPKYSPCPSVFFLYHRIRPSVSVFFSRWRICMSIYGPLKIRKSAKSGRKSVRPFIENLGICIFKKI